MSDKELEELEEYIRTIEPNFDSHIEKGTIEMNNEHYNLLEERMARLINENQELKKQPEEAQETIILLKASKPMLEYKKALEENQQKEFIDYLENEITYIKSNYSQINGNYMLMQPVIETLEKNLTKFKEIIGVSDENNT